VRSGERKSFPARPSTGKKGKKKRCRKVSRGKPFAHPKGRRNPKSKFRQGRKRKRDKNRSHESGKTTNHKSEPGREKNCAERYPRKRTANKKNTATEKGGDWYSIEKKSAIWSDQTGKKGNEKSWAQAIRTAMG